MRFAVPEKVPSILTDQRLCVKISFRVLALRRVR